MRATTKEASKACPSCGGTQNNNICSYCSIKATKSGTIRRCHTCGGKLVKGADGGAVCAHCNGERVLINEQAQSSDIKNFVFLRDIKEYFKLLFRGKNVSGIRDSAVSERPLKGKRVEEISSSDELESIRTISPEPIKIVADASGNALADGIEDTTENCESVCDGTDGNSAEAGKDNKFKRFVRKSLTRMSRRSVKVPLWIISLVGFLIMFITASVLHHEGTSAGKIVFSLFALLSIVLPIRYFGATLSRREDKRLILSALTPVASFMLALLFATGSFSVGYFRFINVLICIIMFPMSIGMFAWLFYLNLRCLKRLSVCIAVAIITLILLVVHTTVTIQPPSNQSNQQQNNQSVYMGSMSTGNWYSVNTNGEATFHFTPNSSGYYTFSSQSSSPVDPKAVLYNGNTAVAQNDDGGAGYNFRIRYYLNSYTTYTLITENIGSGSGYSVRVVAG
ncbi:MAG: hypothetical protein FWD49_07350 [Firmicutes bacterium]|nr:hypothetical protein [Bacillota bacterium]